MTGNKFFFYMKLVIRGKFSCTFDLLPSNIVHKFGITDCYTKQCIMLESISARLAAPSRYTGSSNNEHSAGTRTALDNWHTYFVSIFGI